VKSLRQAVKAYQINTDDEARSAVLTAASSPRSQVVTGPHGSKPMTVIGMVSTPDSRHVIAYDKYCSIQVIGDNGTVERETKVSGLRGAVIPAVSRVAPAVSAGAVAPDASRVALGTDQGTVAVIDTATGRHIDIDSNSTPIVVRWIGSAANGLVLIVSTSGIATTYNPETGQQVTRFPDTVYDALPLADEQHIVTSGRDGRLRVWDARTGTRVAESSTLNVLMLRRYAQSVVSFSLVGENPAIVVWNWQAGPDAVVRYPVNNLDGIRQLIVNAQIVITSQHKRIRTFSLVDGSKPVPRSLPPQAGLVNNVAVSSDGQWITTAGADGRVLVWFVGPAQSPPHRPHLRTVRPSRRGHPGQLPEYGHGGDVAGRRWHGATLGTTPRAALRRTHRLGRRHGPQP
jgi:WD40 repeat protein